MPRDITVTLSDGKQHIYKNAPDNLTPGQVIARATKQFGQPVKSVDGGRKPAAAKPAAKPGFGPLATAKRVAAQAGFEPAKRKPVPVRTKQQEIQDVARGRVQQSRAADSTAKKAITSAARSLNPVLGIAADFLVSDEQAGAAQAGAEQGMFGLPTRVRAGARNVMQGKFLQDGVGGENFEIATAENRIRQDRAPGAALVGNVLGSVAGGGAAARGVSAAGSRLAASASPAAARVGNVLQRATTLRPGSAVKNTAKLAGAGALGGGAQAIGEGSDVGTGVAIGAAAPVALGAGVKLAGAGAKLVREGTRPWSKSVPKAIREVIKEDPAALAARQAELSARTGTNVPLIAVTKDDDFKAVTDKVLKRSPEAMETAKKSTGNYVRGFMDRMIGHVTRAGRAGDAQNTNIADLAQLRKDTADDLMRPIEGRMVDMTQLPLDDLERQVTRTIGGRIVGLGQRIREALTDLNPDDLGDMGLDASDMANARRLMTEWGFGTPVTATVREMDSLRRALDAASRGSATNPANAMAFKNAARVIADFVSDNVPGYRQMVDTYAAQSRMMEGFKTAAAGKRITDIEDDLLRSNLRTSEGRVGMKAGELYRQREAVASRPTKAMATAREFAARGALTRPASIEPGAAQPGTVTQNLGEGPAAQLADVSEAETQVLGRVLDTEKLGMMARNEDGALSPQEIVYGAFLGNALASTQARFAANILNKLPTGINKDVANNISEMLFSQDPAMTRRALNALQRAGFAETQITQLMREALPASIAAGSLAAQDENAERPGQALATADTFLDDNLPPVDEAQAEEIPADDFGDSPYAADLQDIYNIESPELLDLIDRVAQQESGGNQFDSQGNPLESSAGAIGVMQVMPGTAPEAAALAGVEYDEEAYRTDPVYNRLIGIAYLSEMLRRYDGDVEVALAAYNAGPGAVDRALNQDDNWLASLPAETQDYVARIAQ